MSIAPLITFKAGRCDILDAQDATSRALKIKPLPEPGYLYLYSGDDLTHFCWRKRDQSVHDPELDLIMVPTDAVFVPYEPDSSQTTAKTNGRIFVLKFTSSSQRYFFWMQSKPQSTNGDPSWFSPRDRKIGKVVNDILQGEEVDAVVSELTAERDARRTTDSDGDAMMEDIEEGGPRTLQRGPGSGGAGPDATGGDVREEGEDSREGGADGARAASSSTPDVSAAVRNLLDSLRDNETLSSGQGQGQRQQRADIAYPYLHHLLPTSITIPLIDDASDELLESLLSFLPPAVIVLATTSEAAEESQQEPSAAVLEAAKASLSVDAKRSLLKKVLRSPQFTQALGTLTQALRDGGLPGVADALGVRVENGGYLPGSQMPLGGGQAVKAFVDGVRKAAKENNK
ncbi:hypothetical protein E4U46_007017 [Claviceps purpurea]|nr:hypothetical protein E4U12_001762 [Claviceps purpurea]KAG6135419.1 hypothetical protein E4U28_005400 [Claviceps purpurea]KAG6160184.1 hypothetical protein E4U11_004066 [Claviceps purpurea]KAG6203574.1 hypothetical protein E4U50_005641 [Claviceps purpurea]KAG6228987.1 hypothetical protein E4U26_000607 [Claviceps purpurea]